MPSSSHATTRIIWPRLPPSLFINPSPPGYVTRRNARKVVVILAPFCTSAAGDLTVTAVSDGQVPTLLSLLSGITPRETECLQRNAGLTPPEAIAIDACLIRGRGHAVLVDIGAGGVNSIGGAFIVNLVLLGVRPEEIDTILPIYVHSDHVSGLLTVTSAPAYLNATVFLSSRERVYWLAASTLDNASNRARRSVLLVHHVLTIYVVQIREVDGRETVTGIHPYSLSGHTPGHTGYRLGAGDTSLLIWGDIVHFSAIRTTRPPASVAFDVNPEQAQQTRECLLCQAANEQWLIAGIHLGLPGFTRMVETPSGHLLQSV